MNQSVDTKLTMNHWLMETGDGTWVPSDWVPRAALYSGDGRGQLAGADDPIGLFGSHVTFLPHGVSEDVRTESLSGPLMDLDGIRTPSTPSPR